jgi:hypothetical protein
MKIVNVRHDPCTHYCGRGNPISGIFTGLGNPFPMVSEAHRERAIKLFEQRARSDPDMRRRIMALPENAVLGCWCKPKACHADVIVALWKEWHGKKEAKFR